MKNIIDKFDGEFAFLSNFHPSWIEYEGLRFPTVEHAFQAYKTQSHYERQLISQSPTPAGAKAQGRKVHLRADWEQIKDEVMEFCLRQKFQDPVLRRLLLSTGDAVLIEGNTWHDNYWGICVCDRCQLTFGQNHLGSLLMKIREEIIKYESNT